MEDYEQQLNECCDRMIRLERLLASARPIWTETSDLYQKWYDEKVALLPEENCQE